MRRRFVIVPSNPPCPQSFEVYTVLVSAGADVDVVTPAGPRARSLRKQAEAFGMPDDPTKAIVCQLDDNGLLDSKPTDAAEWDARQILADLKETEVPGLPSTPSVAPSAGHPYS